MKPEYKVGDKIDVMHGTEWSLNYATIIYFKDDNIMAAEMNYPGHDGCRWAHSYDTTSDRVRKSQPEAI